MVNAKIGTASSFRLHLDIIRISPELVELTGKMYKIQPNIACIYTICLYRVS